MDINAEVSTQLSLIDALLSDLDKPVASCANKKNEKKEEENQNAMPDSTTNTEKNNTTSFHCGNDVLVPNKDGRYYLGTVVELGPNNDSESRCLVKFGDGTRAWAPLRTLKLLTTAADDGRIMCVVCKRREDPPAAAGAAVANAVLACDLCGRGYHAKCHSPPVQTWIAGASWHCKRCVDQRYRVAAAENRALKRNDFFRFKGGQQRRQHQELTPPCDTASSFTSTSSTTSDFFKISNETHCYCGEKSDWLAQMLMCCRCSRWFHQRCVASLQFPLYAGDKLYIFSCGKCNGGYEYLRRLELSWQDLAHLALYNLTAYNAPNYFELDDVIMPYILDNWHALQLPEKMCRTPTIERRERILTALTSSRKRFKCGREMKKRATIWGLRLRRPPPPPAQLAALDQIKSGVPLTDSLVREYAPRLKFLSRPPSPRTPSPPSPDDSLLSSSKDTSDSSYKSQTQCMIVPVDGHWLNLMMGKRFHENLNSLSNSENDSTSSYESVKTSESSGVSAVLDDNNAKDSKLSEGIQEVPVPPPNDPIQLDQLPAESLRDIDMSKSDVTVNTHTAKMATMNLEMSKMSTKNIIERSKIMSLQHMNNSTYSYSNSFPNELESSGDESSSRGTLDAIIPPLKDFQGKNNPFLMQNSQSRSQFTANLFNRQNIRMVNGKHQYHPRLSLPAQLGSLAGPLVRPLKRKLSEKDIVIGPNGEVKRRKYRRPRKYLQLNKSCPLPADTVTGAAVDAGPEAARRRLRQRQHCTYYQSARRGSAAANTGVRSLQLSPHKAASDGGAAAATGEQQLSALKSSVQSYFRAGQSFRVLARRVPASTATPASPAAPAYLIQWDAAAS